MTQALAGKMPQAHGGLGLLIAQRIVQQMQGQLSLESQLGAGTRAAFSLQLRQVPGSATFEPEAAPAAVEAVPAAAEESVAPAAEEAVAEAAAPAVEEEKAAQDESKPKKKKSSKKKSGNADAGESAPE